MKRSNVEEESCIEGKLTGDLLEETLGSITCDFIKHFLNIVTLKNLSPHLKYNYL